MKEHLTKKEKSKVLEKDQTKTEVSMKENIKTTSLME